MYTRRLFSLSVLAATLALSPALHADVVTEWNRIALQAIQTSGSPPPVASRNLAITHLSIFDAVNAIDHSYRSYAYTGNAPIGTSKEAAAAQAAHDSLVALYPTLKATFDNALTTSLNKIADGTAKQDGITLGSQVGQWMVSLRANDGSATANYPYVGNNASGQWRPTGPNGSGSGLLPGWGNVQPFSLTSGSVYRQSPPPLLTGQQYTEEFNQVKTLGSATSTVRTADQTQIALFWADGGNTSTPPGHWNRIAADVAAQRGNSLVQNARMFALLNMGLADSAISVWDMKYTYNCWRPVTAIREADQDGNPDTISDTNWTPLLTTPMFPSYSSGHSAFSTAGATILADFYGTDNIGFDSTSEGGLAATRHFDSFSEAATEAGMSRIYGGIHFMSDNTVSNLIGSEVGRYVFQTSLQAVPEPGSLALGLGITIAGASKLLRRRKRENR